MAMPGPGAESVTPEVRHALAPLTSHSSSSAIVTDFDGTLAPIIDDPAGARALDGTTDLLARLARSYRVVAVVSGRSASFLSERLSLPAPLSEGAPAGSVEQGPSVHIIGLYGLERAGADGVITSVPEAEPWRPVVDEAAARLRSVAPAGIEVEAKGLAVTVHWRRAPEFEAWVADEVAAVAARSGLRPHPGRMSFELRAPVDIDKGTTVRWLVEGCSAASYFGDDVGDLPAFAALADLRRTGAVATVSVAVVDDESAPEVVEVADVVLNGPNQALALLGWLARSAEAVRGAETAGGG